MSPALSDPLNICKAHIQYPQRRELVMTPAPPRPRMEKFVIRLPSGMRQRIAEIARFNARSMNSEIVHRLRSMAELEDALERAHKVIDQLLAAAPGTEEPGART